MKLDTASAVQPPMPENANMRAIIVQEDSQIHNVAMMGVMNTQARILRIEGKSPTQFQSRSNHAGFAIRVIANPIQRIAKVKTA